MVSPTMQSKNGCLSDDPWSAQSPVLGRAASAAEVFFGPTNACCPNFDHDGAVGRWEMEVPSASCVVTHHAISIIHLLEPIVPLVVQPLDEHGLGRETPAPTIPPSRQSLERENGGAKLGHGSGGAVLLRAA